MRLTISFTVVLAALSCALVVDAATISGRFTYDGVDVNDVFSPPLTAVVLAYDFTTSTNFAGTVNVDAGTYVVTGVPVGDGAVLLEIDRETRPTAPPRSRATWSRSGATTRSPMLTKTSRWPSRCATCYAPPRRLTRQASSPAPPSNAPWGLRSTTSSP